MSLFHDETKFRRLVQDEVSLFKELAIIFWGYGLIFGLRQLEWSFYKVAWSGQLIGNICNWNCMFFVEKNLTYLF